MGNFFRKISSGSGTSGSGDGATFGQQQQSTGSVFGGGGGGAPPAPFGAPVQPMVSQAQRNTSFCVDLRNPEPVSFELSFDNSRTLAPATFHPHHQQQQGALLNLTANKTNQHSLDIIMETVKKDMQEWAKSGIWPYSCYGPVGGKPCVPGFEDLSVDEYRYNYMLNGGNLPPQIPLQFQNTFQLRQSYQQPTHENRLTIERIATQQTASIFGGGASQQSQGALGAASIFGGGGGTSLFGGGTQQQQPQGQTQAGSKFGGGATFGQQQQSTGSIFGRGGTQTSQPGGLFSSGQQQQQQPSLFGQPAQQPQPSLFGQPQAQPHQPSLFGQAPQQQQQPSLFQAPQNTVAPGNLFQPQQPQQQQQVQGGLFQMPPQQQQQPIQQPSNVFGGAPSIFGGGGNAPPAPFEAPVVSQAQAPSIFGEPTGNSPLMQGGAAGEAMAPQQQQQPQQTAPLLQQALGMPTQETGVNSEAEEDAELTPWHRYLVPENSLNYTDNYYSDARSAEMSLESSFDKKDIMMASVVDDPDEVLEMLENQSDGGSDCVSVFNVSGYGSDGSMIVPEGMFTESE